MKFMELLQLRYFCDAAKSENFAATAARFGVPPSDISQSIKRLERELGALLFTRGANRVRLNDKGRAFLARASEALSLISLGVDEVRGEGECARLSVCIDCNRRIVMNAIERLKLFYPKLEVYTTSHADPGSLEFDVTVTDGGAGPRGYDRVRLLTERIVLATHQAHPLAERECVTLGEIAGEPMISLNRDGNLGRLVHKIFNDAGYTPRVAVECDDPFYFRRCLELGLGIALVPDFSWRGQISDDIRFVSIGDYTRDTYVYVRHGRHEVAARLVELLKDEASENRV